MLDFLKKKKKEVKRESMLDNLEFRESVKSEIVPLLKKINEKDSVIDKRRLTGNFDEIGDIPLYMDAQQNYKNLQEMLSRYGADQEAMNEMGLEYIMDNLGEAIDPGSYDYSMRWIDEELKGKGAEYENSYRIDKGKDYIEGSVRFKKSLMIKLGISDDEVGATHETAISGPSVKEEKYEVIEQKPVDLDMVRKFSQEISELFKYDSRHAGEISSVLNKGIDMVSRSSLPEEIIKDYLDAKNYYSKVSSDQIITKTDSSMNMLRTLSNNLNSYFAAPDN